VSPDGDDKSSETRHTQPKRQLKKPSRSPKETKKLVLSVYGMSAARIDTAVQEIENLCKDSKKQKTLKSPQVQEFLSKMTHDQVVLFSITVFLQLVNFLFLCCCRHRKKYNKIILYCLVFIKLLCISASLFRIVFLSAAVDWHFKVISRCLAVSDVYRPPLY